MNLTCLFMGHSWDDINESLKICRRCSEVKADYKRRIYLDEHTVKNHGKWNYKPKDKK